jgi:hypothetical protein
MKEQIINQYNINCQFVSCKPNSKTCNLLITDLEYSKNLAFQNKKTNFYTLFGRSKNENEMGLEKLERVERSSYVIGKNS